MILALIYSNLLTGVRIYSKKIIELYHKSFDEMKKTAQPIQKYLI